MNEERKEKLNTILTRIQSLGPRPPQYSTGIRVFLTYSNFFQGTVPGSGAELIATVLGGLL